MDDVSLVRKMTAKLLVHYGITVSEASNGMEAVAKFKSSNTANSSPFDAVFMDSQMRIMDGPTAAAELRKAGFRGKIYGVTGSGEEEVINFYKEKGADEVVTKPLSKATLLMLLEGIISIKQWSVKFYIGIKMQMLR